MDHNIKKYGCILLIVACTANNLFAQTIKIKGTVLDSKTHQAISFVSVYCKKALVGDNTDDSGRFSMLVPQQVDMLFFSEVGNVTSKLPYDIVS